MKWYITEHKLQKSGKYVGMVISVPYETRELADTAHTKLVNNKEVGGSCQLVVGPDDLGEEWQKNLELWKTGDFIESLD